MNTKIEVWNGHKIRFVEKTPGEYKPIPIDAARASKHIPVNELLACGEEIISTLPVSTEYFALTNNSRILYINHWYGDSEHIQVPNVAREVKDILSSVNAETFKTALKSFVYYKYESSFMYEPCIIMQKLMDLISVNEQNVRSELQAKRQARLIESPKICNEFGGVYFMRADNGITKIGWSSNVNSRLEALQSSSPCKLKLILFIKTDNAPKLESKLHGYFSHKRLHGEWFNLDDSDIETVRNAYAV